MFSVFLFSSFLTFQLFLFSVFLFFCFSYVALACLCSCFSKACAYLTLFFINYIKRFPLLWVKMKKKFRPSLLCCLLLLILLLCFPSICLRGARSGLLLWFETILPILFPFMITIRLFEELHLTSVINRLLSPLICRLFSVSPAASFTIVSGFLCGFPLGAKSCAERVADGSLSKAEGQYLLSFCNQVSPSFLLGYITIVLLDKEGFSFFLLSVLSAVLTGRLLYHSYYHKTFQRACPSSFRKSSTYAHKASSKPSPAHLSEAASKPCDTQAAKEPAPSSAAPTLLQLFDRNILSCAELLVRVGGFMILFSILSQLAFHAVLALSGKIPAVLRSVLLFFCGTLEVTQGTSFVNEAITRRLICLPFLSLEQTKTVLILILTSFGGFSAIAQTQSVISKSGLSIRQYFIARLVNACITGLLCILFLKIRHFHLW